MPNLYPALSGDGAGDAGGDPLAGGRGEPDLFASRPARGAHEVVVNAPDPVSSLAELRRGAGGDRHVRLARAHARARGRRLRARDRERGQGGRARRCRTPTPSCTRCRSCRPRWRASASASPPTPTAPRAATCSRTSSRRRCAGASGSWRSTTRRSRSRPSPRACRSTSLLAPRRPVARFADDGPLGGRLLHQVLNRLGADARLAAAAQHVGAHGPARRRATSAGESRSCRASRSSPGSRSAPACTSTCWRPRTRRSVCATPTL